MKTCSPPGGRRNESGLFQVISAIGLLSEPLTRCRPVPVPFPMVVSSLCVAIPSDGGGPGNYPHLGSYSHGEYPSAWSYKATWEFCSLASILPSGPIRFSFRWFQKTIVQASSCISSSLSLSLLFFNFLCMTGSPEHLQSWLPALVTA